MQRFELICRLKNVEGDGHKLFRDTKSGRLALADNSGDTPDQTDDGVLFINQHDIIMNGLSADSDRAVGTTVTIPLLRENEEKVATIVTISGAMQLLDIFELPKVIKMRSVSRGMYCDVVDRFKIISA